MKTTERRAKVVTIASASLELGFVLALFLVAHGFGPLLRLPLLDVLGFALGVAALVVAPLMSAGALAVSGLARRWKAMNALTLVVWATLLVVFIATPPHKREDSGPFVRPVIEPRPATSLVPETDSSR